MPTQAGEIARKTADLICSKCGGQMHVTQGVKVPKCTCGNDTFVERRQEPSTAASEKRR
ncbi:MAG: zinc ribbon-containing protein [Phycisphaerae bacterium]|nr:zinc ribbon-containing protein [Phycisphaerae bacterium]